MPEDLLERVLGEIRERKRQARAAVDETQRLEAALAALETTERPAPGRPARARRPTAPSPRAPRGQTRDAVLRVVQERPGVTAAEVARAASLDARVVHSTLRRLVGQGLLERYEAPGGGTAYRVARDGEATPS